MWLSRFRRRAARPQRPAPLCFSDSDEAPEAQEAPEVPDEAPPHQPMRISQEAVDGLGAAVGRRGDSHGIPFDRSPEFALWRAETAQWRALAISETLDGERR